MPQASDELRGKMMARFGDIDPHGPQKYLFDAGYGIDRHFCFLPKPKCTTWGDVTPDEMECLEFLVDEWDYGHMKWGQKCEHEAVHNGAWCYKCGATVETWLP